MKIQKKLRKEKNMHNKRLTKWYSGVAVAAVMAMLIMPLNVFAAPGDPQEVNSVDPSADNKADDPMKLTGIDPTAEDDPTTDAAYEGYVDTNIDVWGYTEDKTVYSVDVEWGAMTFQYEKSSWNPETHQKIDGAGWQVYDLANDKVLGDVHSTINQIAVTNHSNASVFAKLSYAAETGTAATTGVFSGKADADTGVTDTNATFDTANSVITLQTADNGTGGAAGTPAVGNIFFKPSGDVGSDTTIDKWTKIGKITVAISATDPTTPAP